jgi:hypothetical protein
VIGSHYLAAIAFIKPAVILRSGLLSVAPGTIMQAAPWRNLTTILPRVVKRPRPSHPPRTGRGRARPRLHAVMSHPRYPTANSILKLAAKHGFDVRIIYDADGRITGFETIGKAGEPSGAPCNSVRANPWDGVFDADKKWAT